MTLATTLIGQWVKKRTKAIACVRGILRVILSMTFAPSSVHGVLLLGFYLEMSRKHPLEDSEACSSYYRKGNRKYCPHCDQSLSVKTLKTHKRIYFDEV